MKQKIIIVGFELPNTENFLSSIEEMKSLAASANYETERVFLQKGKKISPKYYIGSGKVGELKQQIQETEVAAIVFDQELTPVHFRNLEEELDIKILDRTMLILEIFENRAKTRVSKLQVALAKDQYLLPRLIGKFRQLSRQRGGLNAIGGPGEQKLELERRRLRQNIYKTKVELNKLVIQRRTQRKRRQAQQIFTVAIVGYTNAGKSTLLNALASRSIELMAPNKDVFTENILFASLETAARRIVFSNKREIIAIDTIGFVKNMPAHLVAAFRSTLEEIVDADLIIHVIDASNADYGQQTETVNQTLQTIGASNIKTIYALNKIDETGPINNLEDDYVAISALNKIGLTRLEQLIFEAMEDRYQKVIIKLPYSRSDLFNKLQKEALLLNVDYGPEVMIIDAELLKRNMGAYLPYLALFNENEKYYPS